MNYTVVITRDGDKWLADVPSVPGAHTFARSLTGLIESAREVIILMDDLADDTDVDVILDIGHDDLLNQAAGIGRERTALTARDTELQALAAKAAKELTGSGLSVRDAGALLGMTPGRISQLTNA